MAVRVINIGFISGCGESLFITKIARNYYKEEILSGVFQTGFFSYSSVPIIEVMEDQHVDFSTCRKTVKICKTSEISLSWHPPMFPIKHILKFDSAKLFTIVSFSVFSIVKLMENATVVMMYVFYNIDLRGKIINGTVGLIVMLNQRKIAQLTRDRDRVW